MTGQPDAPMSSAMDNQTQGNGENTDPNRPSRKARFEIDETTRSIIVTADASTNEQIRQVIAALDKPVPQALIRVLFLEVTHSDDLDVGLDISNDHTGGDGNRSILSSLFGVSAATRGGIATILHNDLEVTLAALADVGTLNVLSRPSILARNNQEATITIGQEVPFISVEKIFEILHKVNNLFHQCSKSHSAFLSCCIY